MIISKRDAVEALKMLVGYIIEKEGQVSAMNDPALSDFIETFIFPLLAGDEYEIPDPEAPEEIEDWEYDLIEPRIMSILEVIDGISVAQSTNPGENGLFLIFQTWGQVNDFCMEYLRRHRPISYAMGYPERAERILDHLVGWGFADEYDICERCGTAIRTSPTHYGWQPDFFDFSEQEMVCGDCIRSSQELLEEYILENIWNNRLVSITYDLSDYGFTVLDLRYEHGLHYGQNDDPRRIVGALKEIGVPCLFTGTVGQFDVNWNVWIPTWETMVGLKDSLLEDFYRPFGDGHPRFEMDADTEEEWERVITDYLLDANTKLPYDPGREMAKALSGKPTKWVNVTEDTSGGYKHVSLEITESKEE